MGNILSISKAAAVAASASAAAQQVCNNHAEFCSRSYSNVTEICSHNCMFNVQGSLFSNQEKSVMAQLNDGVRILQGQTHSVNGALRFCHTSCSYLDAGPIDKFFGEVSSWMSTHPNDVVSVIIANNDNAPAQSYVSALQSTGLASMAYVPPKVPMAVGDWPTLGQMIAANQRIVIFIDNGANQAAVPYILDQFSQLWETPFDPTGQTFPCKEDRPPGLSQQAAANRMYLANHNLNIELKLGTLDILMPNRALLPLTNAAGGYGSLGQGWRTCVAAWGRPPKALLVDFYDIGDVFTAARQANGL